MIWKFFIIFCLKITNLIIILMFEKLQLHILTSIRRILRIGFIWLIYFLDLLLSWVRSYLGWKLVLHCLIWELFVWWLFIWWVWCTCDIFDFCHYGVFLFCISNFALFFLRNPLKISSWRNWLIWLYWWFTGVKFMYCGYSCNIRFPIFLSSTCTSQLLLISATFSGWLLRQRHLTLIMSN